MKQLRRVILLFACAAAALFLPVRSAPDSGVTEMDKHAARILRAIATHSYETFIQSGSGKLRNTITPRAFAVVSSRYKMRLERCSEIRHIASLRHGELKSEVYVIEDSVEPKEELMLRIVYASGIIEGVFLY